MAAYTPTWDDPAVTWDDPAWAWGGLPLAAIYGGAGAERRVWGYAYPATRPTSAGNLEEAAS